MGCLAAKLVLDRGLKHPHGVHGVDLLAYIVHKCTGGNSDYHVWPTKGGSLHISGLIYHACWEYYVDRPHQIRSNRGGVLVVTQMRFKYVHAIPAYRSCTWGLLPFRNQVRQSTP